MLTASALLAIGAAVWPSPSVAQTESQHVDTLHFRVQGPQGESQRAVLTVPKGAAERGRTLPVLIALHGRAESREGPERGYLAWPLDYRLARAFGALRRGRVQARHYNNDVAVEHLRAINASLGERPFGGIAVLTPFTPDLMEPSQFAARGLYGDWLAGAFLEQARSQYSFLSSERDQTGIDGVSLGGLIALQVGFTHTETFRSVGGLQPALRGEVQWLAELAPNDQEIRLLSSDEDQFLRPTRRLSEALRERHIAHRLTVVNGGHNREFNRGPGGVELLRFHERVLGSP